MSNKIDSINKVNRDILDLLGIDKSRCIESIEIKCHAHRYPLVTVVEIQTDPYRKITEEYQLKEVKHGK